MALMRPDTLAKALAIRARAPQAVLAGGTDFFPAMGANAPAGDVLDITAIPELRGITRTDDGWCIGATETWAGLVRHPLPAAFNGLKEAAGQVGSVQIQNTATVAGNICNASPAADGVPALLTLGARLEVASPRGRRVLDLADFITGVRKTALAADEIVTAILIPPQGADARGVFEKLGSRRYLVISIAMVAVLLDRRGGVVHGARVAVGACSPVACRLPGLEAALAGMSVMDDLAGVVQPGHLAPLSPVTDIRGRAEYRQAAVLTLLRRALRRAAEGWR